MKVQVLHMEKILNNKMYQITSILCNAVTYQSKGNMRSVFMDIMFDKLCVCDKMEPNLRLELDDRKI